MLPESKLERNFWRFWLSGLMLLSLMIAVNPWLSNDVSPWGIGDHQAAATAARVDDIHRAWQAADVLNLARFAMIIDLVYIAVYSFGAYCGGRFFAQSSNSIMKRLGWIIVATAIILGVADYIETICQLLQIMTLQGNSRLAAVAAAAQPIKSIAFLTTFLGLLAALFLRRMARRAA